MKNTILIIVIASLLANECKAITEKVYAYNDTAYPLWFDFLTVVGEAKCHYRWDSPIAPSQFRSGYPSGVCEGACYIQGYITYPGNPHGGNATELLWEFQPKGDAQLGLAALGFHAIQICGQTRAVRAFEMNHAQGSEDILEELHGTEAIYHYGLTKNPPKKPMIPCICVEYSTNLDDITASRNWASSRPFIYGGKDRGYVCIPKDTLLNGSK